MTKISGAKDTNSLERRATCFLTDCHSITLLVLTQRGFLLIKSFPFTLLWNLVIYQKKTFYLTVLLMILVYCHIDSQAQISGANVPHC